jgi:hypothetical protein
MDYSSADDGKGLVIASWVLLPIGFILCCCYGWVLNIVGAVLGAVANSKANPKAQLPMILNGVAAVIGIVWLILAKTVLASYALAWQQQLLHQQQQQQQLQQQQFQQQFSPPGTTGAGAGATAGQ